MGCSTSSSGDVAPRQQAEVVLAGAGQSSSACRAPVPHNYAAGFVKALEDEYLRGVDQAVGTYFNSGVPGEYCPKLDPFEDRVRNSPNKQAEINRIKAEWNLSAVAPPAGPMPLPPRAQQHQLNQPQPTVQMVISGKVASGTTFAKDLAVTPQTSAAFVCEKMGLQSQAPSRELALKALGHSDLEVKRNGLNIAYSSGVQMQAHEVSAAESAIRDERQLPSDWDIKQYAAGRYLEGGLGGRQASTVVAFETQPQAVVDDIQAMFDDTYRKVYTRDRRGAPIPDRFVVHEVQRVLNDQVWREYLKRRQELRAKFAGVQHSVPDGAHTMNSLSKRRQARGKTHLPQLDASVNEAYLFHGTTKAAAQGIAENDFRLDLTGSNAGTLYGKGIYLAENASKSDEYGEGPKGPAGTPEGEQMEMGYEAPRPPAGPPPELVRESYILLCRSTLGKMRYTDEKFPNPDDLQNKCLDGTFNSVLGDRLKIHGTFRELIVYDDDYVYPEYIIRYERVFFHEQFGKIYSKMTHRRRAGQFSGLLPEEKEVLTSMWNIYGMPNRGRINKWQLLDLLKQIQQPPKDEGEDLDQTFKEWDSKKDGWIDVDEFLQEMETRIRDGIEYDYQDSHGGV